jgi:hypothetical protein
MRSLAVLILSAFCFSVTFFSCDPHIPPTIEFKTGGNYTSEDVTVAPGTSITVGIIAKKREDDMKRYNISYAYDGNTSTTSKESFSLSGAEEQNYDKDYTFSVRNQAGTEDWFFVITDRDGNIAKLKLHITVN